MFFRKQKHHIQIIKNNKVLGKIPYCNIDNWRTHSNSHLKTLVSFVIGFDKKNIPTDEELKKLKSMIKSVSEDDIKKSCLTELKINIRTALKNIDGRNTYDFRDMDRSVLKDIFARGIELIFIYERNLKSAKLVDNILDKYPPISTRNVSAVNRSLY